MARLNDNRNGSSRDLWLSSLLVAFEQVSRNDARGVDSDAMGALWRQLSGARGHLN